MQPILPIEVARLIEDYHRLGRQVVFVSGVFDLLHQEHITFLEKAKAIGDVIVVAIESDARVRQIKGEGRPVNSQQVRKKQLEELGFLDVVFVLPENFSQPAQHRQIIDEVRPAFLAVSSHTSHLDKKKAIVEEFGGQLRIVHQHNPDISTTKLLAKPKA